MQKRNEKYDLVSVVGPTACGKTSLAVELALSVPGAEIISADSRQVYRGMDIGTAKPTASDMKEVKHHLIDMLDISEAFSVRYCIKIRRVFFHKVIQQI